MELNTKTIGGIEMQNIQIEGFTLKVKDFVIQEEEGKVFFYITDCEIDGNEFEDFQRFLWNHSGKGEYFTTTFNNEPFHGRFGQLIYSKQGPVYNLRLVFVNSSVDAEEDGNFSFVTRDHEYSNIFRKVVEQEIMLERLINTLKEKDILSEREITDIVAVTQADRYKHSINLRSEIEDLEEYLKKTKDTIADIKAEN